MPTTNSEPHPSPLAGLSAGAGCDFCGAEVDPARALDVGVRHPVDDGGGHRTVGLRFCDSSHAAGFLAQGRLADVEAVGGEASAGHTAPQPAPGRGVDRVLLALLAAFAVSLALMLVGCWQIAQWVLA